MDAPTIEVYERSAARWQRERSAATPDAARALGDAATAAVPERPVVDLGCGPGWHASLLGERVVALDGALAMLDLVPAEAPAALRVQADLAALPFARSSIGGAWASRSYVHLPRPSVPLALHDLHRSMAVGAPAELVVFTGDTEHDHYPADDFPGRRFSAWPPALFRAVVIGAGFTVDHWDEQLDEAGGGHITVRMTRARTLADTVGPGMRALVCGLNPSLCAADAGVGFFRPGNRFWPAALAAGLVSRDRDPVHALRAHGVGMTDLVKRGTARADVLTAAEYRAGIERLELLAGWLAPGIIIVVGLAGWRAAVDRRAVPGPQLRRLGGRPVYLMPSTSGLNAHSTPASLTAQLREATQGLP